jgi:hypothetical protein
MEAVTYQTRPELRDQNRPNTLIQNLSINDHSCWPFSLTQMILRSKSSASIQLYPAREPVNGWDYHLNQMYMVMERPTLDSTPRSRDGPPRNPKRVHEVMRRDRSLPQHPDSSSDNFWVVDYSVCYYRNLCRFQALRASWNGIWTENVFCACCQARQKAPAAQKVQRRLATGFLTVDELRVKLTGFRYG